MTCSAKRVDETTPGGEEPKPRGAEVFVLWIRGLSGRDFGGQI